MVARSGKQFLQKLDSTPRELRYGDKKITDSVSEHSAFRGVAKSIAALYDMQLRQDLVDIMTYESGISFGGRQDLYERFFFGDPVRMANAYYGWYDKEPYKTRVRELLHRNEDQ